MSGPILETGLELVKKQLVKVPDDKRIVGFVTVNGEGTIRAGTAIRINQEWVFDAAFEKEKGRELAFEAMFTFMK